MTFGSRRDRRREAAGVRRRATTPCASRTSTRAETTAGSTATARTTTRTPGTGGAETGGIRTRTRRGCTTARGSRG